MATTSPSETEPSPPNVDAGDAEGSALLALAGLGCPSCQRTQVGAAAWALYVCRPPSRLRDTEGAEEAHQLVAAWQRDHAGSNGFVASLRTRGWVPIDARFAAYLASVAVNVPRLLLGSRGGRSNADETVTYAPTWAAILLGVGVTMKKDHFSVGAWKAGSRKAPPDETLVNWPKVLRLSAANPTLRRQLYVLLEGGGVSTQGLYDWLALHAPEVFGR